VLGSSGSDNCKKRLEDFEVAVSLIGLRDCWEGNASFRIQWHWRLESSHWTVTELATMYNDHYIKCLKEMIFHLHGVDSKHIYSAPVKLEIEGASVWRGIVEVFALLNHPAAKHAFVWQHALGPEDDDERYFAMLEIPPVVSPETAVQAIIAAQMKG
jgi:hypothetical protein